MGAALQSFSSARTMGAEEMIDLSTMVHTMAKVVKTAAELERMILELVRAQKWREGISNITVQWHERDGTGANWEVKSFNAGTSGRADCDAALAQIVPRFQRQYDVVSPE